MPSLPGKQDSHELILVTGASGYIASQLIPRLLERGLRVRCLVRNPQHLHSRQWFADVEVVCGDLTQPESILPALQGVSTAYYLVHSMSSGNHYIEQDLQAARSFAASALQSGVGHIIYLGGLADPQARIARHLRSRLQTGEALRTAGLPVTEFRAGVIVGPGSISFEMIRFLTEQFPLIICPRWMPNLSQPISIQNILDYLLAALDLPDPESRVFEIGGSEVMTYAETMLGYARLRGLRRRVLILPFNPAWLLAYFMAKFTPVPASITRPLVEGLCNHSIVRNDSALQAFPHIHPMDYKTAVRDSLGKLDPRLVEPLWRQIKPAVHALKHAGFCILQYQTHLEADPGSVLEAIQLIFASGESYKLESSKGHETGSGHEHILLLRSKRKLPGQLWREWRVSSLEKETRISQAMLFAPRGLPGFLWWYVLGPWLRLSQWAAFRKLARQVSKG
jgi:uncharacterized protein YbjT (DUF2867 family)